MAVNHIVINGETILDMRGATATAADIPEGLTAFGATGELLVGTAKTTRRTEVTVPLPMPGWTDMTQTVAVDGMTAGATVITGADLGSETEYTDCGVYCSAQSAGELTFSCASVPAEDLTANVVFFT